MSIAGYLFEPEQCKRLTLDWQRTLDENGLKYFRMSECAHGTGEFKKLSRSQRLDVERKCINHIKTRMTRGFAISMSEPEFLKMAPPHFIQVFGNAYTACTVLCLASIGSWARERGYKGPVAYFFESGHRHVGEAAQRILMVRDRPDRREEFRYGSHTFADKKLVPALQSADILAWQWRKALLSILGVSRRRPRADLMALLENSPHTGLHITGDKLRQFMQTSIDEYEQEFAHLANDAAAGRNMP